MIIGLILAAGKSERMGQPKAFLPFRGGTFLSSLYSSLTGSPLDSLRIVVGHEAEAFIRRSGLPRAEFIINADYEQGMLSSIQAGLAGVDDLSTEAILLFPVDHPLVPEGLIGRMIGAFQGSGSPIVVPVHGGRRGHPVLFGAAVFGELLAAPASVGARAVLHSDPSRVLELEAGPEILYDIDTPEDYRNLPGGLF